MPSEVFAQRRGTVFNLYWFSGNWTNRFFYLYFPALEMAQCQFEIMGYWSDNAATAEETTFNAQQYKLFPVPSAEARPCHQHPLGLHPRPRTFQGIRGLSPDEVWDTT